MITIPGINKITLLQKMINSFFIIKRNDYGFYCDAAQKIRFVCKKHLDNNLIVDENEFIIKLSCDGTQLNKKGLNLLNFTFTVINCAKQCKTVRGNFILGNYKCKYFYIIKVKSVLFK